MILVHRLSHPLGRLSSPDPFAPAPVEARWNSHGVQVAYAGEHIGLTAMEILTYWANYPNLQGYDHYMYPLNEADIEDALTTQPGLNPHDKSQTRPFGDTWAEEGRSLALRVPSVVLPASSNYVINPNHPAYDPGKVVYVGPFVYDQRITSLIEAAKRGD
ncbi:RES family NAD+ phosphorylase [Deinococcus metallilatus]|uniref:RES family NAD+ phosphorylase n=1 Tax=Deinococcus metallilatus TaxID=1211322 RepID=UPI00288B96D4|nr:RES family NAD+ phosphorylase [Deinococcus metallilatus]